jgi:heat-inducible transcriptional repressor
LRANVLDERKAAILRAVVEEYIQTAQPVGSASVTRAHGMGVSPATVRHEMGTLERDGYLVQPHTSAGRVPTDKGYRFFVDHLVPSAHLDEAHAEQIRTFFASAHGELERMLADTSKFLAGLTDYAAVVVRDAEDPARVRSVQLVCLSSTVALLVVVLASGAVEKRTVEVPAGCDEAMAAAVSERLSALMVGSTFGTRMDLSGTGGSRVGEVGVGGVDNDEVATIVEASLRALYGDGEGGSHSPQVFVGGASHLAAAFDAVGTIRNILDILEQQYVLVTLIKDVIDSGLSVAIGAEHGVVPLADCSIVVAPYRIEGERAGTVGILGPTRMHYEQTLAAVGVVSRKLSQALSKGSEER